MVTDAVSSGLNWDNIFSYPSKTADHPENPKKLPQLVPKVKNRFVVLIKSKGGTAHPTPLKKNEKDIKNSKRKELL